jgi:acetyltransferase-like isoleucine patch superfamily enzyme
VLKSLLRTSRFVLRRGVLFLVNLLAVPPENGAVQALRCRLMRLVGSRLGVGSQLSESLYIYDGRNFNVGACARIGSFCRIWDFCPITIGDNLLASHGLTLISGTHLLDAARTDRPGPITIGNNVWIGINVTIVGPATIGDNVVIGASSIVMGDLESDCVYAGSPAKRLRSITPIRSESLHLGGGS